MKVCSKCKVEKPVSEYNKLKRAKSGLMACCKDCQNEKVRKYKRDNRDKINALKRKYYNTNKEKLKEKARLYRKEYYKKNKDVELKKIKENQKKNLNKRAENKRIRRLKDPLFRLKDNVKGLIYLAFIKKGYKKNTKTAKILGCSFKELEQHIEKQFNKDMTWEDIGKWHIDHIIPVASAINEEELYKLNHYTNLQPMWGKENIQKSDNFNEADKKKYLEWYDKNV